MKIRKVNLLFWTSGILLLSCTLKKNELRGKWKLVNTVTKCDDSMTQWSLDKIVNKFDTKGTTYEFLDQDKYIDISPLRKSMGLEAEREGRYEHKADSLILFQGKERAIGVKIVRIIKDTMILQFDMPINNVNCRTTYYYSKTGK